MPFLWQCLFSGYVMLPFFVAMPFSGKVMRFKHFVYTCVLSLVMCFPVWQIAQAIAGRHLYALVQLRI